MTADLESQSPTLSDEYVLTEKPDVILGLLGSEYDTSRLHELHPTWDVVPALPNDRVYGLPPAVIARPAPRVIESARRLAEFLHPERSASRADATSATPSSPALQPGS